MRASLGSTLLLLALAVPASGAAADSGRVVDAECHWSSPAARPGDQRVLAVILRIESGYHINPDESRIPSDLPMLIPTRLEPRSTPAALEVGAVQYPEPKPVPVGYAGNRATIPAYAGRVVVYMPVRVRPKADAGQVEIPLRLVVQACDERTCLPPARIELSPGLDVESGTAATGAAAPTTRPEVFEGFDRGGFAAMAAGRDRVRFGVFGLRFALDGSTTAGTLLVIGLAALGGFLLNLTPCVLPVVPLKIMGLSQAAGTRGRCLALGGAMAAGVVAFWMGLGLAVATIGGVTASNQLFQVPAFGVAVGLVIGAMGLAMVTGAGSRLPIPRFLAFWEPERETLPGAAALGVLTAILSTPCTAPFMGAAAAWAATESPGTALAAFASIGAGMASPYLVLAAFPGLIRRVPRAGPGSVLVKQLLGLLLLAAAAYFLGVGLQGMLGGGEAATRTYWTVIAGVIVVAGLWLGARGWSIARTRVRRGLVAAGAVVLVVTGGAVGAAMTRGSPIDWKPYSPEAFERARRAGKVVVLDFTAEWCLNCKALEQGVLQRERVVAALEQRGVVPMKVDLTGGNEAGTAKLNELGRITIPLLAVYGTGRKPLFMSDAYTADQVLAAIERARRQTRAARRSEGETRS